MSESPSPPPATITESLASTRQRRANAGANMSKLLDKEEDDEFYQTQYGGFIEVDNDNDFSMSDSSDSENVIDSDFDIDERVDIASDDEHEEKIVQQEEKRQRRQAVKRKTGVYREPSEQKVTASKESQQSVSRSVANKTQRKSNLRSVNDHSSSLYKNLRESTKKSSRETKEFLEDERRRKMKSKNKFKRKLYHQPTQEERLREAKRTEVENMRSLEQYKNLEIEKSKRNKMTKKIPNVPMITYHSYSDESIDNKQLCCRTIISFPNEELFEKCFARFRQEPTTPAPDREAHWKEPTLPKQISALSNMPIRFKDPLTEYPYSSAKEFSIIREAYVRYLELSSLKDDQSIKKFIETNRITQTNRVRIKHQAAQPLPLMLPTAIHEHHQESSQYRVFKKPIIGLTERNIINSIQTGTSPKPIVLYLNNKQCLVKNFKFSAIASDSATAPATNNDQ